MLKGTEVSLREYRKEDLPFILRLLNDVSAGFDLKRGAGVPLTEDDVEAVLREDSGPDVFRYVVLDGEDRLSGIFKITLSPKDQPAELEHRMLPSDRDRGHDRESLKLILNILFNELNMNRCMTILFDFEDKALASFTETGFQTEATLRHHVFHRGSYHDAQVLGILKEEYQTRG